MKLIPTLTFALLLLVGHCYSQEIDRIAIGSCSHEYDPNQMWSYIMENDPDLWVWLGDIIYGDSDNPEVLRKKYAQQKSHPDYQKLLSEMPVIGIWDDHDYGVNDGGKEYPLKEKSKEALMDFLDVPETNPVFSHEGAYNTYLYGSGNRKVKVILLDARYFRDPLEEDPRKNVRYKVNPKGDVLGEEQWRWLEKELSSNEADIHLICSGIQIIPWQQGFEKWSNFPAARKRLLNLIEKTNPNRTVLLSGDRHIAEISKTELPGLDFPLYEFTSSGLTHTWKEPWDEENQHRVGELIMKKNFGIIDIQWGEKVRIEFQVRGQNNELFFKHSFEM